MFGATLYLNKLLVPILKQKPPADALVSWGLFNGKEREY